MRYQEPSDVKKRIRHREDMFLRRLFGMLAKMAKADGKVDAWEAHAAERAFARFPRAAARRRFCIRVFNEAKDSRIPLARMAWDFANKWACAEDCLAAYEILWDIACATGVLKPVHRANLASLCRYLNLPESYFGIYCRKRQGTFREWTAQDEARTHDRPHRPPRKVSALQAEYDLIGCAPDASDDAVRSAYRTAAKACPPDLLRARGLSDAQIATATAKMARINEAWAKIRKERGI